MIVGELAGDLHRLTAARCEERIPEVTRQRSGERSRALRPHGGRNQPVAHVTQLLERAGEGADRERRAVAEVEHAARAAAVQVRLAVEVPDAHALAVPLHDREPEAPECLDLCCGHVAGDEL